MMTILIPPEPLTGDHRVDDFSCGEELMDAWLKRRALPNQSTGATRTYVVTDQDRNVVGFYSLATGAILPVSATGRFRRNMPDPIPIIVLARLAVDCHYQGQGLSRALVGDAIRRVLIAADLVGIRGIVVHALNEGLRDFYTNLGFSVSPVDDLLMMVTLHDLRSVLGSVD